MADKILFIVFGAFAVLVLEGFERLDRQRYLVVALVAVGEEPERLRRVLALGIDADQVLKLLGRLGGPVARQRQARHEHRPLAAQFLRRVLPLPGVERLFGGLVLAPLQVVLRLQGARADGDFLLRARRAGGQGLGFFVIAQRFIIAAGDDAGVVGVDVDGLRRIGRDRQ